MQGGITMDSLILSCSTGGGHNAAGKAIRDELLLRGHNVQMIDPYSLFSEAMPYRVGNAYVKTVQRMPKVFGMAYAAGEMVRRIPAKSPIYWVNIKAAEKLADYLKDNHYDYIIMPHLFPAEMLTHLKKQQLKLPITVFVATDYTCIPFTEETECDYYIIPGAEYVEEFRNRGINEEKLMPFGIPAASAFYEKVSKQEAKHRLNLDTDKKYILAAGGSIGAGDWEYIAEMLVKYRTEQNDAMEIIMICGNNEQLYEKLLSHYSNSINLIKHTNQMPLYMKACDVFISKPGGLSSTEAAVSGAAFIQITSIPGCESHNMNYFVKKGMAIGVKHIRKELIPALEKLSSGDAAEKMRMAQKDGIPDRALFKICDWLEETVK